MKKVLSAVLTAILIFFADRKRRLYDNSTTVEAKSYRSGSKSFKSNNNSTNNNTFQQRKADTNTTNRSAATTNTKRGFFSGGGFMRGLMIGRLAGLLLVVYLQTWAF